MTGGVGHLITKGKEEKCEGKFYSRSGELETRKKQTDEWVGKKGSAEGARTWRGCRDNCQEKEREDRVMRDRLDRGGGGAECLGDMRDSLAVRRAVMMADGNHSSYPPPPVSPHRHTYY